jgi:hypothetical protein
VQGPCDRSTNTPRCSGDNCDPSCQGLPDVPGKFARRGRYRQELAVHKSGPAGEEEPDGPQRTGAGCPRLRRQEHTVAGGAAAQFLGQGAQEPVHPLPGGRLCR